MCQNLCCRLAQFPAGRRSTTSCAPVSGSGLHFLGKAARCAAVLGDEVPDGELCLSAP
ncbi:MAG: hypothetical protein ACLVJH_07365 [Faecalibacterium prausnitzii]